MSTPTISNSTKVSIALVVTIVLGAYALGAKFSSGDAKDMQQDAIISSMASNIATLTDSVVTIKGDMIEVKTIVKSLAEQESKVTVAKPAPTRPIVVVASHGSTQPITQSNNQDQPPNSNQSPQPQSPDPPQQAQPLPCTLLPVLCNQGRFL